MNRMHDLLRISQDSALRLSENHRCTAKTPRRRSLPRVQSAAGGIRVALHDANDQPIAGFGLHDCDVIRGDDLAPPSPGTATPMYPNLPANRCACVSN